MVEIDGKQVRVAILGGSCIGKTCIVKRFCENTFHGSQYTPTAGVDFVSRRLSIKSIGTVTLIILDISGSALTSKMLDVYLHGIDIYLLTYDMTNATSLQDVRKWMDVLSRKITIGGGDKQEASIALVGSKGDLEHLRTVRLDGHTRFAQEFNIPLSFLVSAKSGESVLSCFSKCTIYHLSPEAKQRVKDHAILQSVAAQKKSAATAGTSTTSAANNSAGSTTALAAIGTAGGAAGHPQALHPLPSRPAQPADSSVVCSVQ